MMKSISDVRILVVGDIMLDKYTVGDVDRISPEAPVPVVKVTRDYSNLGGCGNVVRNIKKLGALVDCVASVGEDYDGYSIRNYLDLINVGDFLLKQSKITTVKERIVANSRQTQMIRVDRETTAEINSMLVINKLDSYFSNFSPDVIVVSDYAKGMITMPVMQYLKQQKIKIIVDPKPQHTNFYNDVFMITPNEKEWKQMVFEYEGLETFKYVLVTLGKKGMELRDFNQHWRIDAENIHDVYNVSGAGDTVVAVMATCIGMKINPVVAARVANSCAGYVVTMPGTTTVPKEYFQDALKKYRGK